MPIISSFLRGIQTRNDLLRNQLVQENKIKISQEILYQLSAQHGLYLIAVGYLTNVINE